MNNKVTIGGDRLGAGNKMQADLHNYSRSTHDLSGVFRTTMASGTLVPFLCEVGLPGDSFEINLDCDVKTHPTIGPLFGSYKVQLDVFQVPIRLYNGKLHMNLLNIGLNMSEIKLPQMRIQGRNEHGNDLGQINPSSIFSYLNINGLGYNPAQNETWQIVRNFNATSYLAYYDIYKQYYANKQEEFGVIIHNDLTNEENIVQWIMKDENGDDHVIPKYQTGNTPVTMPNGENIKASIYFNQGEEPTQNYIENIYIRIGSTNIKIVDAFEDIQWNQQFGALICNGWNVTEGSILFVSGYLDENPTANEVPQLVKFPLTNIDEMRKMILADVMSNAPFMLNDNSIAPYGLPLIKGTDAEDNPIYSATSTQEGLCVKTYQSDLFNNWIQTEWIDGENGINSITAVDVSQGYLEINALQLSNKVYDMLNRIAISGGTYDDWLNAVYTHERIRSVENPIYMGGLSKELAFQEVISNASTTDEPLGTLAGRGVLTNKHKGGKVNIKIDEPSYIMGIVSLTPRIDYSQGNRWDTTLETLDDFHKPGLDEIGFQDVITDQMAWFDTIINDDNEVIYKSVGKQPAWVNYMTNVNRCKGNFADKNQQMYMTLNRRYEWKSDYGVKDLTTYVDPLKFNHIFADTSIDAQNFWVQIGMDITARRKMSAKLMPNL